MTVQMMAGVGQWPQSPPMPQQSIRAPPQAWPISPWPYYGQPSVIQPTNVPGHGPQGAVRDPMEVALPDKQISVDGSQEGDDEDHAAQDSVASGK